MTHWARWGLGLCGAGLVLSLLVPTLFPERVSEAPAPMPSVSQPAGTSAASRGAVQHVLENAGLAGITLGMHVQDLVARRPDARRHPPADAQDLEVYVETLDPQQALYFVESRSELLVRVQLASTLRTAEALLAQLESLRRQLGTPDGIWDCPAASQPMLATRRFVWWHESPAAMAVVHLAGDRALMTLYVASAETLKESLALAQCAATRPEDFARFPGSAFPMKKAPGG